ncbi:MAG: hypothetical protein ACRCWM_03080 [Sarcina sp.]
MLDFFINLFECASSASDANSLLKSKTSRAYKIFGMAVILVLLVIMLYQYNF